MRLRKRDVRARVKGPIPVEFSDEALSSYGGLELLRRFVVRRALPRRLREALAPHGLDADYGVFGIVGTILALIIVGGWRLSHVGFVGTDPVILRFAGLKRLPSDRTLGRWLQRVSDPARLALETLIRTLVYEQIERSKLRRLTVDIDGTVLRTGVQVEGAARGFNPHHPKDKSYYPITAHLAELGQILRVWNRPGNVNDSHNAVGFVRGVVRDLRERFGRRMPIRLRMDGAFFGPAMLQFLDEERDDLHWAMKVPLWEWLGVREQITARHRWWPVTSGIEGFSSGVCFGKDGWPAAVRVVIYRKRVFHRTRKNYQLDLFSPDDGTFEYSAVATNLDWSVRRLWHFMAGRGAHEKTLGELKSAFAFDAIPSQDRQANAAWQMLSVLALNLIRDFQIHLGALRRNPTWKSTYFYRYEALQTLRFTTLQIPARLVRPQGRTKLRLAAAPRARDRLRAALRQLDAA